jgi:hypothetical protein
VILDAIGADQIRDAFATAAGSVGETAEETADLCRTLAEASEQYDAQRMAASTVDLLRQAAGSINTARAGLEGAGEKLQAALADFNDHDGQVAEAVAEAGNLMQAEGYTAAFTVPGPAEAGSAVAVATAPEPVMSPGEYLAAVQDLQDAYNWMSMNAGNPAWRPSPPSAALTAQLAADDQAEDDGMHADERRTCFTHQSWLADCVSDPSHSNPGTRDKPGSSYNWCTDHRAPVQVCACWPATLDGRPPARHEVAAS